jgi:hypothetical protein
MSKVDFSKGLKSIQTEAPSPTVAQSAPPRAAPEVQPSRVGKVAIAAYFEPEVRKQLALISVHNDTTQSALLAEALNMVFEKYGYPPIA